MTDFTLPSIHLNGTGRKRLTEDYTAAYHKLIEFRDSFWLIVKQNLESLVR